MTTRNSSNDNALEYDRNHFFQWLAELVPQETLFAKNITRQQLVTGWCAHPISIILREDSTRPYVATVLISSLNPLYNITFSHLAMAPLLRHPFLFGTAIDSIFDNHRTATGALAECTFPADSLDETGEDNIVLYASISVWMAPIRLGIKRAWLGESKDYQLIRDL